MLRRLALALVLAFCAEAPAVADDSDLTSAVAPGPQRAFSELSVDGVDRGQSIVWIDGDDILLPAADAVRARVPFAPSASRALRGVAYVSLAALAPGVTFAFDPKNFRLAVTVNPALLARRRVDVGQNTAAYAPPTRPASAYANYRISAQTGGGATGALETGFSAHDSLLYSSESIATDGTFQRGSTYFSHDDAAHLRRGIVGDTTVVGDALLGEIDLFGAGVRRLFEIDPYVYRFPTPSVSGLITAPGNADVYVNGLLARSIPLQPGGFDLGAIPVGTGLSDVSVVVRDANGNVRTYRQSYFSTDALLQKGLTDYNYGIGFLRRSDLTDSYGRPAVAAAYRAGVSDDATLGARFASTTRDAEFEATSDVKVGSAVVHVGEAVSDAGSTVGTASDFAIAFTGRSTTLAATAIARENSFGALVANDVPVEPAHFELQLSASQRLARTASLSLSVFRQTFASLPAQSTAVLTFGSSIGRESQIEASIARSQSGSGRAVQTYSFSAVRSLGPRTSLTTSQSLGALHQTDIDFRVDPPSSDTGFGYDVRYDASSTSSGQLELTDHAPIVDLIAYVQTANGGSPEATLSLGGSVTAVDGHVMASRPVGDAFTLVESGAVGGVPVVVDGRPVGRTDRNGLLVVPSIGSFAPTRVALDIATLPLGVDLANGERYVAPGFHGGSVASFGVSRLFYFVGTVALAVGGVRTVPVDGTLALDDGKTIVRSTLDDGGAYYFENLAPGRYRAVVRYGARECAFDLDVPRAAGVANDLGAQTCGR